MNCFTTTTNIILACILSFIFSSCQLLLKVTKDVLVCCRSRKSSELKGVRELMKSPVDLPSPRLAGVRELMTTPKEVPSPVLVGVRRMGYIPKELGTPKYTGIKDIYRVEKSLPSPDMEGTLNIYTCSISCISAYWALRMFHVLKETVT